ncbi:hypothetical protein FGB62_100g11 [Gracilaria domingensis]|nr:hypothetical protein FGB62_100g11 [Gracilaria domingensis]
MGYASTEADWRKRKRKLVWCTPRLAAPPPVRAQCPRKSPSRTPSAKALRFHRPERPPPDTPPEALVEQA